MATTADSNENAWQRVVTTHSKQIKQQQQQQTHVSDKSYDNSSTGVITLKIHGDDSCSLPGMDELARRLSLEFYEFRILINS